MSKKSRKLIRSAQVAPAASSVSNAEPAPDAPPAHNFWFLPDLAPQPVDERDLHDLMQQWRHGRATRSVWDAIQDAYVAIFTVLMVGAMIANLVINAQSNMASCSELACQSARTLVPWATWFALLGLAIGVSRLFGPVLVSAAEGFWLMDAPIERSRLLSGRLRLAVIASGLIAAVLGGLTAALSGSSLLDLGLWALADGLGAAAMTAFAAAEQTRERTRVTRWVQTVLAALALATLLLTVAVAAGWTTLTLPLWSSTAVPAAAAAVGLILLVVELLAARRRLGLIRRARLVSGGSLVAGMQGAMYALDFGLVRDIVVERAAVERGHVKPTHGRGTGLQALLWRDLQRLLRFPRPLVALAASVVTPYALDALGMTTLNPFISGLVLVAVLVPFLSMLRVLTRTGGLARMFPFRTSQVRTVAMMVPLMLALIWQAATIPAFVGITAGGAERSVLDGALIALITGLAGWLGAVRWVTAKKVDFNSPMVATESGAVPPTLILNLFRGLDMVALITAPVMLGQSAMWSFSIAALAFIFLRGTFNTEEMKAQQEQLNREKEAAKNQSGQKIKVQRPTR
ncbi:MAG: ABC transporter permease [Micropruina sp.]|nr:ABC transporter permease [Micropruina sp.]